MFEELLIPLLLSEVLSVVQGKTRFQKLVYIIQKEAAERKVPASSFEYELYYYGPFSSQLSDVLENLKNDDLLVEETEMTPNGYSRYVYSLTDKGRRLLENSKEKKILSRRLEAIVREVATEYGNMRLSDLVDEAYRRYST
jgi:uncharacterized protein YwgA